MLEYALDKRRILELYLNVAEWGEGVFGCEAAARHYFNVSGGAARRPSSRRGSRRCCRGRSTTIATAVRRIWRDTPRASRARMNAAQVP